MDCRIKSPTEEIDRQREADEKCANGEHRFVECDEWDPTCINCGKFQQL